MGDRSRSRSPRRRSDGDRDRPKKSSGGFRWKDKRRDGNDRPEGDERRLNRGYRDRSPRRERDSDRTEERARDDDRERKPERDEKDERREQRKKEKREKKKAAAAEAAEPTMVVYVNDRLGTKAAIPCLGSDPISGFLLHMWLLIFVIANPLFQSCSRRRWRHELVARPMQVSALLKTAVDLC